MSNDIVVTPESNEPPKSPKVIRVGLDVKNLLLALVGASAVVGVFALLNYVGSLFLAIMPVVLGGTLFAAIIGTFFFMLRLLKSMRTSSALRLSFSEIYTGVAVFSVMGLMANASMQVFLSSGHPIGTWNNATVAAGAFAAMFGIGRFIVDLWNSESR